MLFLPALGTTMVRFKSIWAAKLNAICWLELLFFHRNTMLRIFSELMASGSLSLSRLSFPRTPAFPKTTPNDFELSKYVQRPVKTHMTAIEHTLRYLRGTFDKYLHFSRDCPVVDTPWGWVDSDWAGDLILAALMLRTLS